MSSDRRDLWLAPLLPFPFGSMSYDRGLVERVRDSLARLGERGIREKNVFGGWGFLVGTGAFVIVWTEGLLVKLAPGEYDEARALPGVEPFAPGGERPMGTWLVATSDVTADDLDLADWVGRGLRGVRAVPPPRRRPRGEAAPPAATPPSQSISGKPAKRSKSATSRSAKLESTTKKARPSAATGSRKSATERPSRAADTPEPGRHTAARGAKRGATRPERKQAGSRPARRPSR